MPTTCLNSPSPAESQLEEGLRNTEAFRFEQGTGMLGWSRWVSLLCTFGWWKKCIVVFRFWIIFAIIILNSFSCRLISSSFIWFGGHLSCSFTCWVFLCLFFLFRLLCLGRPFCILAVCQRELSFNHLYMNPNINPYLEGWSDTPKKNLRRLWKSEAGEETVSDWLQETPPCPGPTDGQATAVGGTLTYS